MNSMHRATVFREEYGEYTIAAHHRPPFGWMGYFARRDWQHVDIEGPHVNICSPTGDGWTPEFGRNYPVYRVRCGLEGDIHVLNGVESAVGPSQNPRIWTMQSVMDHIKQHLASI